MSRTRFITFGLGLGLASAAAVGLASLNPPRGVMTPVHAQSHAEARTERWDALGIAVHELVLENGFRVLLVEDHRSPRVAASLWYRFGGLQEPTGEHGEAHFLEHAMHQGTTTVGVTNPDADRLLLREIQDAELELIDERNAHRNLLRERRVFFDENVWPATERTKELRARLYTLENEQAKYRIFWEEYNWYRRNGGLMRHTDPVPANTGNELLRIEVDLPAERLELFFRLEADRMVNAVFRGWEAQRFTVLEQFYQLNRHETGRFSEALSAATGGPHPIFNHAGGHLRDHMNWNRQSMLRMYDEFIVPNNATLVLVGDRTIDDVRPLAERYFGRVPRAPEPPARMEAEAEPPPGGRVRLDWLEPLEPQLIVRFRIPGVGDPDRPAFDVIARLLRGANGLLASSASSGAASARAGGAGNWSASATQNGSPNTLNIQAQAARDEDLPALEATALAAVERLRQGRVDPAQLARVQRELQLDWELTRDDRGALAQQIGGFEVADRWQTMKAYLEARRATNVAEIRRVAERYLVPRNRVVATTRRNPETATCGSECR